MPPSVLFCPARESLPRFPILHLLPSPLPPIVLVSSSSRPPPLLLPQHINTICLPRPPSPSMRRQVLVRSPRPARPTRRLLSAPPWSAGLPSQREQTHEATCLALPSPPGPTLCLVEQTKRSKSRKQIFEKTKSRYRVCMEMLTFWLPCSYGHLVRCDIPAPRSASSRL